VGVTELAMGMPGEATTVGSIPSIITAAKGGKTDEKKTRLSDDRQLFFGSHQAVLRGFSNHNLLITSQPVAQVSGACLLSRDSLIQEHTDTCRWRQPYYHQILPIFGDHHEVTSCMF